MSMEHSSRNCESFLTIFCLCMLKKIRRIQSKKFPIYFNLSEMVPRPQFSPSERSFIYKLYTVHSTGRRNTRFLNIRRDFTVKFPQSTVPSKQAVRDIVKKFDTSSTVHNLNSKKSPGNTYSGRPKLGFFFAQTKNCKK